MATKKQIKQAPAKGKTATKPKTAAGNDKGKAGNGKPTEKPAGTPVRPKPRQESDSSVVYVVSFAILSLAVISFIAIISYFVYWQEDQSISEWGTLFVKNPTEANNFMGRIGAVISNVFVGKWFGIFGISIPVLLAIASFLLVNIRTRIFRKSFISIVLLTLIGSVTATYLTPDLSGTFGSSLGGGFGLYACDWMTLLFGDGGTGVVLFALLGMWLLYTYKNTARYVRAFFRILRNLLQLLTAPLLKERPRPAAVRHPAPVNVSAANHAAAFPLPDETGETAPRDAEKSQTEATGYETFSSPAEAQETQYEGTTTEYGEKDEGDDREILRPNEGMQLSSRTPNRGIPTDFSDYSNAIDPDNVVLFTAPTFDNPSSYSPAFDDNDPDLQFGIREIEGGEPETPAKETPAAREEEFEITQPRQEEPDATARPEEKEPDFEINVPEENVLQPEEKTGAFEVSVTDNTEVRTDDPAAESQVVVTTNDSEEMADIDDSVFDPTRELSRYKLPSIDLLENHTTKVTVTKEELVENKNKILETLHNFNIQIDSIKATVGPTVTLYEIVPAPGVRISKIKNLEDDIALSLSALGIRIIAPIPGKGTIGIEVPNKDKETVSMYSVIKSAKFQESKFDLPVVLGRTIQNEDYVIDLAKMPHLLVAGATGQGKSVGLNAIITSLLYKKHPAELKLVLVDPKKVELTLYSHLEKHFLAKLPDEDEAIITDTQKVIYTLNSLCSEMDSRYDLLKKAKVRNIKEYNEKFTSRRLNPRKGHRFLPYIVVIIDEFADLIMTAGREIETPIARIAQLARAVGIHLVIATQRPTTNIITGLIKANFPARIAFRVMSMIDSRTILDQPGANQLIGRGDMLVSTGNDITRVQCAFIDTPEVEKITEFIGSQTGYPSAYDLPEYTPETHEKEMEVSGRDLTSRDGLFDEVARYVVTNQQGSASTIQRNFNIGFNRAGRIMDQLERAGIVGKQEGSKPRKVLIGDLSSLELILIDLDRMQQR